MRVLMAASAQGGRPHEFRRPNAASGEAFRSPILLPQPGFAPQWVEGGFVVLGNADGTLNAVPFSPDGHWLAYQSDQTGRMEVYVQSYPEPGARVPVSLQGGSEPVWARNGRELFYRAGDSLMVASVTLSPEFAVAGRRRLFTGAFLSGGAFREYDVAPDDQHFVMISGGAAQWTLIGVQKVFQRLEYERRTQR